MLSWPHAGYPAIWSRPERYSNAETGDVGHHPKRRREFKEEEE